jgi:hypothetical protein
MVKYILHYIADLDIPIKRHVSLRTTSSLAHANVLAHAGGRSSSSETA